MTQHTSAVRDNRKTAVLVTAGATALLMLLWLAVGQTRAAFTATTQNEGNLFTTGTVSLSSTENAMVNFDDVTLLPGNEVSADIVVENGSAVPLGVRLFVEGYDPVTESAMGEALEVNVTLDDEDVVFEGTLAEFAAASNWTSGCWSGADSTACGQQAASGTPGAPTNQSATPGDSEIVVDYDAAPANGAAVDKYRANCTDGTDTTDWVESADGTAPGSITVEDLENGTEYTCAVQAHNANGWGPSAVTDAETPRGTLEALLWSRMDDAQKQAVESTEFWTVVRAADTAARTAANAAESGQQTAQETAEDAVENAPTAAEIWAQVRPTLEGANVPEDVLTEIDALVADGEGGPDAGDSVGAQSHVEDDPTPAEQGDTFTAFGAEGSERTYTFTIRMKDDAGDTVDPADTISVTFVWEGRA